MFMKNNWYILAQHNIKHQPLGKTKQLEIDEMNSREENGDGLDTH